MSDAPKEPEPTADEPNRPALSPAEAKILVALGDASFQAALQQIESARAEPDPAAPDPVIVLPDNAGAAIVADTEAAAVYVQPTARRPGRVPQDTMTRVQVDQKVDPRRQPTERRLRAEVLGSDRATGGDAASGGAVDGGDASERDGALSSSSPSSRPPPSVIDHGAAVSKPGRAQGRGRFGLVWAGGVLVVAVAVIGVWGLRSPGGDNARSGASGVSGLGAMTNAGIAAASRAGGGDPIDTATMPGGEVSTSGGVGAAAPTGTAASTESGMWSGSRAVPKGTEDPYADAAPPVRPSVGASASGEPSADGVTSTPTSAPPHATTVPAVPSVDPTAAPTTKPPPETPTSALPSPKPPY